MLRLDSEERKYQRMKKIAEQYDDDFDRAPDSKLKALINWIRDHLQNNGNWNDEYLIIFTEYRDTQDYIYDVLMDEGFGETSVDIWRNE